MRISCAPESIAARSPASTAVVAPWPSAHRCADRRHGLIQDVAGVADGGEFGRRFPTHQAPHMRGRILRRAVRGLVDGLADARSTWRRRRSAAAMSSRRSSFASALSGAMSAMKVRGFIAPIMFGPPPNRSLCLPSRVSSAMPGSSFGHEIGEIGKLGVTARRCRTRSPATHRGTPPTARRCGARTRLSARGSRPSRTGRSARWDAA